MKNFKLTELLFRLPIVIIGVLIFVKFILNGQLVDALTFLIGAATWEFVLFFLVRMGVLKDLPKYWSQKEDESNETVG